MQFQVGDLVRTTYKNFLFPKGSLGLVTEVLMHGDCGGPYPVMTVRMFGDDNKLRRYSRTDLETVSAAKQ
tara:strand:+ start:180 stop:389 length:210 start_codon:yes stop_codon:yes gene_type:complete